MCTICTVDSTLRHIGGYDVCAYCRTRIASVLPQKKNVRMVLEEHAQKFILGNQKDFDIPTYTARLEVLKKHAPHANIVLDFGCGNGNFVNFLRLKKYKAFGYDKSTIISRHLKARHTPYYAHERELPNAYFDVITCFDVVEHTINPREIIETLRKKLKKGGTLLITTPNAQGISARAFGKHWWVFGPTAHFVLFSLYSLQSLLSDMHFRILDVTTDTITPCIVPAEKLLPKVANKMMYITLWPFKGILFRHQVGDNIQMIAMRM